MNQHNLYKNNLRLYEESIAQAGNEYHTPSSLLAKIAPKFQIIIYCIYGHLILNNSQFRHKFNILIYQKSVQVFSVHQNNNSFICSQWQLSSIPHWIHAPTGAPRVFPPGRSLAYLSITLRNVTCL